MLCIVNTLLREILDALVSVINWTSLGIQLGLEPHEVDEIEAEHHNNVRRCKEKVIAKWLSRVSSSQSTESIWRTLCDALRGRTVDHANLAQTIEQKYCSPS